MVIFRVRWGSAVGRRQPLVSSFSESPLEKSDARNAFASGGYRPTKVIQFLSNPIFSDWVVFSPMINCPLQSLNVSVVVRSNTENGIKGMFVLTVIITTIILVACTGTQLTREGVNQKILKKDLKSCEAIAKIKGRSKFPEILVYSPMEFGGNSTLQDINLENFTRAKIQYEWDCLSDRGYHIE
jgi:hypothetical protein